MRAFGSDKVTKMASLGSSLYSSSGLTTHSLEERPIVIHKLNSAASALKDTDDVSGLVVLPTGLDAEGTEDASESHYYGGDMYYPTLVRDYHSMAKLSVNVVHMDAGM